MIAYCLLTLLHSLECVKHRLCHKQRRILLLVRRVKLVDVRGLIDVHSTHDLVGQFDRICLIATSELRETPSNNVGHFS